MKDGWKDWMSPLMKGLVCHDLKYLIFIIGRFYIFCAMRSLIAEESELKGKCTEILTW